jgi:hypothetical protein
VWNSVAGAFLTEEREGESALEAEISRPRTSISSRESLGCYAEDGNCLTPIYVAYPCQIRETSGQALKDESRKRNSRHARQTDICDCEIDGHATREDPSLLEPVSHFQPIAFTRHKQVERRH